MSQTPQIPLPLDFTRAVPDAFLVGACNRVAVETVLGWPNWPGALVYLQGPAGTGKTHLASLWADQAGGMKVDAARLGFAWAAILPDANCVAVDGLAGLKNEEALFHLTNELVAKGGSLLLTGREPPSALGLRLPDLKSRILAATVVEIGPPDELFLETFLLHLAERVQIAMEPALAAYCVSRMERTQRAAVNLIAALDQRSLAEGTGVRRETVAAALDDLAKG